MIFTILTGIACGLLAGAVIVIYRDRALSDPGSRRSIGILSGIATALLSLAAVTSIWQVCGETVSNGDGCLLGVRSTLLSRSFLLVLMAAAAAIPWRVKQAKGFGSQTAFLLLLLPLTLSAAALLVVHYPDLADPRLLADSETAVGLIRVIGVIVCTAVGVRSLLSSLVHLTLPAQPDQLSRASRAAYGGLTIVIGGTSLASLLIRGSPWGIISDEIKLGAAWVAWSAAWFGPRQPRLREALNAIGSLVLLIVVIM